MQKGKLSVEDQQRIARLFEEVSARQFEAGMIIARTLGVPLTKGPFRMVPKMEITPSNTLICRNANVNPILGADNETVVGCYDHDTGQCYPATNGSC